MKRAKPGIIIKKTFKYFIFGLLSAALVYLISDYINSAEIPLKPDRVFNLSCTKAKDLVVQELDYDGNLWATRGLLIYKLDKESERFKRIARVPTGFSLMWLNNFTCVRHLLLRHECVELVISKKGDICAYAAGHVRYKKNDEKKFKKSLKLPNYGIGIGRGIMNAGILSSNDSLIFLGEYFRNEEKNNVVIYRSCNYGMNWDSAHVFKPGVVRHIHAVQRDPYSNHIWVCAGDEDHESRIGWSDDQLNTINIIGSGSQVWRVCQLVFTENSVLWGTDSGNSVELSGIYYWDKASNKLKKIFNIDGAIFYGTRLSDGTIIFSLEREGIASEIDDITKLYLLDATGEITTINCGTWKYNKPGIRFAPARLRIQRNQGSKFLAVTCLNLQEIDNSDLIIIQEDILMSKNSK
ncbi:MAG: hypothetical protein GX660_01830 [Clostridiaceae bacterium]|nr:hypothetical protein [Clostridiaceae bacterium]